MGITLKSIDIWCKTVKRDEISMDKSIITLGRQSVYFGLEHLRAIADQHNYQLVNLAKNELTTVPAESLCPYAKGKLFIDDKTLFRALGFSNNNIFSMDYSKFEGANIEYDLNKTWQGDKFDFVFDEGTGEHIFSQASYFFNISNLLKNGGIYFGMLPVNEVGHGFFNYSSDSFKDYFGKNGFEQFYLKWVYSGRWATSLFENYLELGIDANYIETPLYACSLAGVYKKVNDLPMSIPNQTWYEELWKGDKSWSPLSRSLKENIKRRIILTFPKISAGIFAFKNTRRLYERSKKINLKV